jgi:hypothetical protein
MSLEERNTWDSAADEHHYLNNILVNIATRTGEEGPAGKAISQAADALDKSVGHHDRGDYRSAHNQIQIAGEHIGRAAALGNHHDKFYGMSMSPKDAAESEAISYKHGYLS